MKKIFFFLVMSLGIGFMYSQPRVSLEHSGTTTIFVGNGALVEAYNAAVNGDVIFLPGGTFDVPSFNKTIKVYGAGAFPDATINTGKTFLNGNVSIGDAADNFYLEGVEITGGVIFGYSQAVNNVTIRRCVIDSDVNVNGTLWNATNFALLESVIIGTLNLQNLQTGLVANNILQGYVRESNGNMFTNNIFLHNDCGYYGNYPLITGSNNTFQNNISLRQCDNFVSGTGNKFVKNIFAMNATSFGTTPTLLGNYMNIDPTTIFVNQTGTVANYAHNYHLVNPTTYLGTDGTEVGIYGSANPFKEQMIPENPHISLKNINTSTNTAGELQIEVKAEAQSR